MLEESGDCSFNGILLVAGPLCQGNQQLHGTLLPGVGSAGRVTPEAEALPAFSALIQLAGVALCSLHLLNISDNLRTEDEA